MVFKLLFWFIAVLDLAHKKVEPCEKSNYTFTEKKSASLIREGCLTKGGGVWEGLRRFTHSYCDFLEYINFFYISK